MDMVMANGFSEMSQNEMMDVDGGLVSTQWCQLLITAAVTAAVTPVAGPFLGALAGGAASMLVVD